MHGSNLSNDNDPFICNVRITVERITVIAPLNFMCIDILNNFIYRNKYINGM